MAQTDFYCPRGKQNSGRDVFVPALIQLIILRSIGFFSAPATPTARAYPPLLPSSSFQRATKTSPDSILLAIDLYSRRVVRPLAGQSSIIRSRETAIGARTRSPRSWTLQISNGQPDRTVISRMLERKREQRSWLSTIRSRADINAY